MTNEPARHLVAVPEPPSKEGQVIPFKRGRKADLRTQHDIRREMAKVYRDTRAGKMDSATAAKLVYILDRISKVAESADIQPRVEAIERVLSRTPECQ